MNTKTLTCPSDPRYKVVLDPAQVFPDDPGQGTPAMLYGPEDASATYFCALDTGEIDGTKELPLPVCRWLESISERVDAFLDNPVAEAASTSDDAPRWLICDVCKGDGTLDTQGVVHPDDFGDEDWQAYLEGRYRTRCDACHGTGKVRSDAPKPIVRHGRDGQPVVYQDEAGASEHLLRMQEGLC